MPSSGAIGGVLKLKGAKPTGIDKKAKKKKKAEETTKSNRDDTPTEENSEERPKEATSAVDQERERLASIQKTESERKFEETRRKRVSWAHTLLVSSIRLRMQMLMWLRFPA